MLNVRSQLPELIVDYNTVILEDFISDVLSK